MMRRTGALAVGVVGDEDDTGVCAIPCACRNSMENDDEPLYQGKENNHHRICI